MTGKKESSKVRSNHKFIMFYFNIYNMVSFIVCRDIGRYSKEHSNVDVLKDYRSKYSWSGIKCSYS